MNEETGITVVGAVGIAAVVIVVILLIRHLDTRGDRGPEQGQADEPHGQQ